MTFLKDVESEYEIKDYIQNYLGDNKEVREFMKQFFDKRLKIQNKQRSSDFVEMKVSYSLFMVLLSSILYCDILFILLKIIGISSLFWV